MIILSTDSLRGYGLNRIFELAKSANYDGIDLTIDFGQFDTLNADYLKTLQTQFGLPIHAISAPEQIATKKIQDLVKMAKTLGSKVLILQPPKIFDFKLANWFKSEIPKLREKEAISIALENAEPKTFLGFIPESALSNTTDLKRFKHVSLDTARIGEAKKDLIVTYSHFRKFLVHVHLSNIHRGKKYAPPSLGILPLESFLTKLRQDNFPGAISIKVHSKYLEAGDDEKVVQRLKEIKDYYEKYYAKVEILTPAEEIETSSEDSPA